MKRTGHEARIGAGQEHGQQRRRSAPVGWAAGQRTRTRGQALIVVALVATLLVLFIGLGVDVAFLMARRANLQSAVDSAALSAAVTLYSDTQARATTRANQVLEASGVTSDTLDGPVTVDFPGFNQVHVGATQAVPTFFIRLLPLWNIVDISAEATADTSSYAEIQTKPYGKPGVVNELNLMVWGADSVRSHGDPYSPVYLPGGAPNPFYPQQPYGYLYRIDVPASFVQQYGRLAIQIWDPDSYNRPDYPAAPCTQPCTPTSDMSAYCTTYSSSCTTGDPRYNTGLKLNAFSNGRPAFWRADEIREPYTGGGSGYTSSRTTQTTYTLWHYSPHNTTAFGDPLTLTDSSPGGPIATYTVRDDPQTDLRWYQPPGFDVNLAPYERESNGAVYFYLYVHGDAGSSENNFDLRVGPDNGEIGTNLDCSDISGSPYSSPCYVNDEYFNNTTDWQDAGAQIFAKRALPLNLDTGSSFPLVFTQVSKNAAGQTLSVRHFDQDCNNGCGSQMDYQMLLCGQDPNLDSSWEHIAYGYIGPDNGWYCTGCADPEAVPIPLEGTQLYNDFFGSGGQCATSWLRVRSNPSYPQDTTVWEMPFLRPRLVK